MKIYWEVQLSSSESDCEQSSRFSFFATLKKQTKKSNFFAEVFL